MAFTSNLNASMAEAIFPLVLSCLAVLVGFASLGKTLYDNKNLRKKLSLYHEDYGYYEIGKTLDTAHSWWKNTIKLPIPAAESDEWKRSFEDSNELKDQKQAYFLLTSTNDEERRKVLRWSKSLGSFWQSFLRMYAKGLLPKDVLDPKKPWVSRAENYREFMEPADMALHYLSQVHQGTVIKKSYKRMEHYVQYEQAQQDSNNKRAEDARKKAQNTMTPEQFAEAERKGAFTPRKVRFNQETRNKLDHALFNIAKRLCAQQREGGSGL